MQVTSTGRETNLMLIFIILSPIILHTSKITNVVLRYWQTSTHCCGHIVADTNCLPVCPRAQHLLRTQFCVRDTKMFMILFRNILCPRQISVPQFARARKHHEQQYVRNNVSSFATAFKENKQTLQLIVSSV